MEPVCSRWETWKQKRRNTVISCVIVSMLWGIEFGIMTATLYTYLKTLIKVEQPEFYYGLIVASYNISTVIFGVISGRILGKYGRVKLYTYLTIVMQVIGNLLYLVPFSPMFPLCGKFLAGFSAAYSSVMTGEIVRIYGNEESTKILYVFNSASSLAFMFAPMVVITYKNINITLFNITINCSNFSGILMAILGVLGVILTMFFVHDCSLEFDMKGYLSVNNMDAFDEEKCLKEG